MYTYVRQLQCVQISLIGKPSSILNRKNAVLFDDSAKVHSTRIAQETFEELDWSSQPHAIHSSNFAPNNYYHFWSLTSRVPQNAFIGKTFSKLRSLKTFSHKPLLDKWQVIANKREYIIEKILLYMWLIKVDVRKWKLWMTQTN